MQISLILKLFNGGCLFSLFLLRKLFIAKHQALDLFVYFQFIVYFISFHFIFNISCLFKFVFARVGPQRKQKQPGKDQKENKYIQYFLRFHESCTLCDIKWLFVSNSCLLSVEEYRVALSQKNNPPAASTSRPNPNVCSIK